MKKSTRVLHRATGKYITIPDVCCIDAPGINNDKDVILFRISIDSYVLQYISRYNDRRIQRMSKKAVHENFRCGYYKIIVPKVE